ncbi:phosphate transport system regulatory protein PhoU, partial [Candidatus Magnetoovum chiemensis]
MYIKDEQLLRLKNILIKMAHLAEDAIHNAVKSLIEKDLDLAQSVIDNDKIINSYDVYIDEECIRTLARRQPVGSDLRFITTAMKITTDIERIGDHALNIARTSLELCPIDKIQLHDYIIWMKDLAIWMVREAVLSFSTEDRALAMD